VQVEEPLARFHTDTPSWRRSQEKTVFGLFFSFRKETFESRGVSCLLLGKVLGQSGQCSSPASERSQMDESKALQAQHHIPPSLLSCWTHPTHQRDGNEQLVSSSSTFNHGKATAHLANHFGARRWGRLCDLTWML